MSTSAEVPVARLRDIELRYGSIRALEAVTLDIPRGRMVALIGPDGVGKSSVLALIAGARALQGGQLEVLDGNMRYAAHRSRICPQIAYMPQGLGKNLYPSLSVFENIDFFARLFGQTRSEREHRIIELTESTGLSPFVDRPAGQLSGGMKQKLGLCCALVHDPDLLILDEPTTGIDPLSRRQFWTLIDRIRSERPGMSVVVSSAYMEEAARFDWLVAMDNGHVLATGTVQDFIAKTGSATLEAAFIAFLPEERRRNHRPVRVTPRTSRNRSIAIEAKDLTMRFGDFVAVDHVNFRIERGEIFGFLGSNGCGKTTTMKMLTGLLEPTEGTALLFGKPVEPQDIDTRRHVGYMSQGFSLYSELSVQQNLELHGRLFGMSADLICERMAFAEERFELGGIMDKLPGKLGLGQRQRLSLAVAMFHAPSLLILDEPTSGADPIARDRFWQMLIDLSRRDGVTIFVSTHFLSEAERCDRVSFMHAGRVLASGTPAALIKNRQVKNLESAFISYLEDVLRRNPSTPATVNHPPPLSTEATRPLLRYFSTRRMFGYARREALELRRDPIRGILALLGSAILMLIMAYGISMDVENLTFAVLDRDQTTTSQSYTTNIRGSRYFIEKDPIVDYDDLDKRMRAGKIALAIEIPPGFGRDIARKQPVEIGAWFDGAMPMRAETVRGYLQGLHFQWLSEQNGLPSPVNIAIRYRYNPDVLSLPAMTPAIIAILLMLFPAMMTALSVVREKELGSIINFYVTPTTRLEFLVGKQAPYIILGILNFALLALMTVTLFGVPLKGSFATLAAAAVLYVSSATAVGLLMSSFMRSQVAAIFGTTVATIIPASQYSGLIDPVSSLSGLGALIGQIYPTTHFLTIARGTFSKALHFSDLHAAFVPLLVAIPVLMLACVILLKKQEA